VGGDPPLVFVGRLSIKEIVRRTGHGRNTIRHAVRSGEPPRYRRPPRPSKLDPFRDEVHRLLRLDPCLPGKRLRELLEEQGYVGSKTILDDYLREVRPLFLPRPRTFQRTSYRPGALCQFDLWQPGREIPVGRGQTRRGYVVVGCLPYSRTARARQREQQEKPTHHGDGLRCAPRASSGPMRHERDRKGERQEIRHCPPMFQWSLSNVIEKRVARKRKRTSCTGARTLKCHHAYEARPEPQAVNASRPCARATDPERLAP
jgi:hypothetical protein